MSDVVRHLEFNYNVTKLKRYRHFNLFLQGSGSDSEGRVSVGVTREGEVEGESDKFDISILDHV